MRCLRCKGTDLAETTGGKRICLDCDEKKPRYQTAEQILAFRRAIEFANRYARDTGVRFKVWRRPDGRWHVEATKTYVRTDPARLREHLQRMQVHPAPQVRSGPFR